MKKMKYNLQSLIKKNKEELLKNKSELEKIEQKIDARHTGRAIPAS
ncbi:FbpB family small basic protein [Fictibacillus aquaticus]|uniref:FbpB family small basic protein n=1 Tax=Fictibacillus aquaticus TaxID=2021314 RepID=A0A235F4R1_9BACL|nr:FbpB family small basic protein [Fictibacillus aquaticus]OYD56204.1 FbpB family small basic protein [Fictibacillus aquaticus]